MRVLLLSDHIIPLFKWIGLHSISLRINPPPAWISHFRLFTDQPSSGPDITFSPLYGSTFLRPGYLKDPVGGPVTVCTFHFHHISYPRTNQRFP